MGAYQGRGVGDLLGLLEQCAVTLLDRWNVRFTPQVRPPPGCPSQQPPSLNTIHSHHNDQLLNHMRAQAQQLQRACSSTRIASVCQP
jgi:hypothetical protein